MRFCQTHKVVNEKQMACFKAHKDKLRQKFRVDPTHLVEVAEGLGQMWVDTLRNVGRMTWGVTKPTPPTLSTARFEDYEH